MVERGGKVSFTAETFGVSERAVVTARRKLIDAGLLIVLESPQWQLNRYGLRLAVDLGYPQRPGETTEQSARPPAKVAGRTAGPRPNSTLLRKNRTLAPRAADGVRGGVGGSLTWPVSQLTASDLTDPSRLGRLVVALQRAGVAPRGEHGRLLVEAAAARALRVGVSNPCGLFRRIVERSLWSHLSALDEAMARRNRLGGGRREASTGLTLVAAVLDIVRAADRVGPFWPSDGQNC